MRPDRACGPCAVLSATGTLSAELFKFSIVSMEWTNLDAAAGVKGTGPSVRYYGGHTMSAVGTDLYLFGGYRISGKGGRWLWSLVSSYWVTVYWDDCDCVVHGLQDVCEYGLIRAST